MLHEPGAAELRDKRLLTFADMEFVGVDYRK
jgi:hypothetical protein